MRTATAEAIRQGARLFNEGRFFEAHEVWEVAWLAEEGETRRLLQGLIQVAAGLHQAFDRNHPRGCARLLEEGAGRLGDLPSGAGGLALDDFSSALAAQLVRARAWERGESDGLARGDVPLLKLSEE